MATYAASDVDLTLSVAREQEARTPNNLKSLISLVNQDLLVLERMEWNGLKFDRGKAIDKAQDLQLTMLELQGRHSLLHTVPNFNWGSNEHLSALLFGGVIKEPIKVPDGHYKTGTRAGQIKYKNDIKEHKIARLYSPPKGAALEKPGVYSVDESVLSSLGKSELIDDLLEIKRIKKEISTYLLGFAQRQDDGHYTDYIYGQFNQCVAATGRLSSSSPNLQNLSEMVGECLTTRY